MRPFLENVTRGRNIPPERLDDVAEHYLHFGGVSPINGINRALIDQICGPSSICRSTSATATGSRTSRTLLRPCATTGFVVRRCSPPRPGAGTPAARSTSEDIARARAAAGAGAPELVKLRQYFDHPLLVEMFADAIADAAAGLPADVRDGARLVFTAHSIPLRAASRCGTDLYSRQVAHASRLVAAAAGYSDYDQVWQSRSGPPQVPWLEPDVVRSPCGAGATGHRGGDRLSDRVRRRPYRGGVGPRHELQQQAEEAGIAFARATTPNADPRFARVGGRSHR